MCFKTFSVPSIFPGQSNGLSPDNSSTYLSLLLKMGPRLKSQDIWIKVQTLPHCINPLGKITLAW